MSKQVLSIEQMHHLQELGLDTSKSSFCRFPLAIGLSDDGFPILSEKEYIISERKYESSFNYPAFTLQDILDLLPKEMSDKDDDKFLLKVEYAILRKVWYIGYYYYDVAFNDNGSCSGENLIDAAYEMLCWCIENGYVETNKEE